jgi:uncharacterized protein (TIGR02145 family)
MLCGEDKPMGWVLEVAEAKIAYLLEVYGHGLCVLDQSVGLVFFMKLKIVCVVGLVVMALIACKSAVPTSNQGDSSSGTSSSSQNYEQVQIGTQIWMAQNLDLVPVGKEGKGAWCYNNSPDNCAQYGRLYDWATAMNLDSSCNVLECTDQIKTPHQGICPAGWHLPTDAEWATLASALGQSHGYKLKSAAPAWDGDNSSGFDGRAAGLRYSGGLFNRLGTGLYLWSAGQSGASNAWYRGLFTGSGDLYRGANDKRSGFSVRCLKD